MKRSIGIVLTICLVGLIGNIFALDQSDIDWMSEYGLTKYDSIYTFGSNRLVTRGEAAKFVVAWARGTSLNNNVLQGYDRCDFIDIDGYDGTLEPFIRYACEYKIIQGYNGRYYPRDNMTQAQALAMAIRMMDGFQDETVSPWYKGYYELGKKYGIISNENIYTLGNTSITRGQFGERLTDLGKIKMQQLELAYKRISTPEPIPTQEKVNLGLEVMDIRKRYGRSGISENGYTGKEDFYVLRVFPEVYGGEAKNLIVQTEISKNHCLELPDSNLPQDFTYVSVNNGRSRDSLYRARKDVRDSLSEYKFICGPALVKVEMPEKFTIFYEGLVFPIYKNSRGESTCHEFLVSSDNAQYIEEEVCY